MSPLHYFGEALRELLLTIPLSVVRGLFVMTLAAMFIWVLMLPRSMTTPPGGANRWDENLKIGAGAALLIQIVIYLML